MKRASSTSVRFRSLAAVVFVLALAALRVYGDAAAQSGPAVDYFDCYQTKTSSGFPAFAPITALPLVDQLGSQLVDVKKTRDLCAGTVIGSGTVSNRGPDGGPGKAIKDGGDGYSCIAEVRMIETIQSGAPKTSFMKRGDRVRIEMLDDAGRSIFGAIDQVVGD